MGFGKSLERAIANGSSIWAGFICLVVTYYSDPSSLTTAKIFSLLEIMVYLRTLVFFAAIGFGFMVELHIIF